MRRNVEIGEISDGKFYSSNDMAKRLRWMLPGNGALCNSRPLGYLGDDEESGSDF